VPAITAKWAEDLLDRAQPRKGDAVLDIACGTGIVARLAAKRMGRGLVTGLDLNTAMLAVARSAPTEGATIIWIEGSALDCHSPPTALMWSSASKDCIFSGPTKSFWSDTPRSQGWGTGGIERL
jgi:trans-aconitate methyltransferase